MSDLLRLHGQERRVRRVSRGELWRRSRNPRTELSDPRDDGSLRPGVLHEDAWLRARSAAAVWRDMPPVEVDEPGSQLPRRQHQLGPVVPAQLHGEIGQCDEECELVGRREVAFGEQALEFGQEGQLSVRGWRRHRGHGVRFVQ